MAPKGCDSWCPQCAVGDCPVITNLKQQVEILEKLLKPAEVGGNDEKDNNPAQKGS